MVLLLTTVTRLPSFTRELSNPDEGFLATQARQLTDGGRLYDTVVDRKPPLVPLLYQGCFAVFGDQSLWPLKVAAVLAVAATALLVASLARRWWGDSAGWTAGTLTVLLSVALVPEDSQAATFEIFMLPWTALAVWCADRRRWALAGLAVAGAALTKQTGGAVWLPVLYLMWRARPRPTVCVLSLASVAAPFVAFALWFGPGPFLYWMVTGSGSYASVTGAELHALLRALGNASLVAMGAAPLLWAALRLARGGRGDGERWPGATVVWVWLGASALGVVVGFQFYGHYYLQLLPPLALWGALVLHRLGRREPGPLPGRLLAATAALSACFVLWGLLLAPRGELDHARTLGAEVRERTRPGDTVLLWGMHPEQYWFADRPPASRYLTAGFLTNYSGGRHSLVGGRHAVRVGERYAMDGAWDHFRAELADHPPRLVVDDSRGKPYAISRTPTLRAYLRDHYQRVGTVGGAVLWERRS